METDDVKTLDSKVSHRVQDGLVVGVGKVHNETDSAKVIRLTESYNYFL